MSRLTHFIVGSHPSLKLIFEEVYEMKFQMFFLVFLVFALEVKLVFVSITESIQHIIIDARRFFIIPGPERQTKRSTYLRHKPFFQHLFFAEDCE